MAARRYYFGIRDGVAIKKAEEEAEELSDGTVLLQVKRETSGVLTFREFFRYSEYILRVGR